MPLSAPSLEEAFAAAKKEDLPVLISYDIPNRVIQDKVRRLIQEKKIIYLAIASGHKDEDIIKKHYELRYLEACLCNIHRNPIKNHLQDCDEMFKAVSNVKHHQSQWDKLAKLRLADGKRLFNNGDYSTAAQRLCIFAFSHGGAGVIEGKALFAKLNLRATDEYTQWKEILKHKPIQQKKDAIKKFIKLWPNTDASAIANQLLNQKEKQKPFLGYCPISPTEISVLKYRIEFKGQRYYMCCGGCLQGAKRQPEKFISRLEATKEKLLIKP